jgi:ureidoglycolate hydrolase
MTSTTTVRSLIAQPITPEAFQPYGQVISATADGQPFDQQDAQLVLDRGIPRFYIMRLHHKPRRFHRITRHQQCTQCLGSLEGQEWFLAVAPPSAEPEPDVEAIAAFRIAGNCFVKLHLGTWHAGPYFDAEMVDFYNLELSDTNINDHFTYDLKTEEGLEFAITG